MTNLGNKDVFAKNLKMYTEQFGKNQKEMAALVQKIKYKKRKGSHRKVGALAVVVYFKRSK